MEEHTPTQSGEILKEELERYLSKALCRIVSLTIYPAERNTERKKACINRFCIDDGGSFRH